MMRKIRKLGSFIVLSANFWFMISSRGQHFWWIHPWIMAALQVLCLGIMIDELVTWWQGWQEKLIEKEVQKRINDTLSAARAAGAITEEEEQDIRRQYADSRQAGKRS